MKLNPHSLFFKIFMGLWITMMIFATTPIILFLISSQDNRDAFYNHSKKEMEKKIGRMLRAAADSDSMHRMSEAITYAEKRLSANVYIFNKETRTEVMGQEYPEDIIPLLDEMRDNKLVVVKKMSNDPADKRLLRAFSTNKYTIIGYPNDGEPTSFMSVIIAQHIHIFLYIIFLALIASFLMGRYITKPLQKLREATGRITDGDFSIRIAGELKKKDEIGHLAADFDQMAAALGKNRNSQEVMLRNISHELRSPLTRLRLSLELARAKAGEPAKAALDRIELESDRLNEMIGWLLEMSRIKSDQDISQENIDIRNLLDYLVSESSFEAKENGKEIVCSISGDASVTGNRKRLLSGLENIVRNAIRYSASKISITSEIHDGSVVIKMMDDGPGVPEESLQDIFTPFYRVHDDRDRKTGGTGLGLAIAKTAAEASGGTVSAYNTPNGGLCIEVWLPAV